MTNTYNMRRERNEKKKIYLSRETSGINTVKRNQTATEMPRTMPAFVDCKFPKFIHWSTFHLSQVPNALSF